MAQVTLKGKVAKPLPTVTVLSRQVLETLLVSVATGTFGAEAETGIVGRTEVFKVTGAGDIHDAGGFQVGIRPTGDTTYNFTIHNNPPFDLELSDSATPLQLEDLFLGETAEPGAELLLIGTLLDPFTNDPLVNEPVTIKLESMLVTADGFHLISQIDVETNAAGIIAGDDFPAGIPLKVPTVNQPDPAHYSLTIRKVKYPFWIDMGSVPLDLSKIIEGLYPQPA